jgi:catechol 2,3-dioxygenase-like lactoylglutathione lyase family enzyme
VTEIVRISRVVADLDRAEEFYRRALAFRPIAREPVDATIVAALGIGRAAQVVARLGGQEIALVRCEQAGRPYPADSRSNDLWFQHLAIVVSDIDAAYAHLTAYSGWRAISEGGPVTLPPANDGVRAFKFRDPDGHPLELIWFPPGAGREIWRRRDAAGLFLGIDHTALAIACTARAVAFYSGLGFSVSARSLNDSPEQSRLDGFAGAKARITALRPPGSDGPGLEVLGYDPPGREIAVAASRAPVSCVPSLSPSSLALSPSSSALSPSSLALSPSSLALSPSSLALSPLSLALSPSSSGSSRGSARAQSVPDLSAQAPRNEMPGSSPGMTGECMTGGTTPGGTAPDGTSIADWTARHASRRATDIATDWVTLAGSFGATPRAISDPDGHLLLLLDQGRGAIGSPA